MKRISIAFVLLVMAAVYPLFPAPVQGAGRLSDEGKQVIDYLLDDWGKQFRSTSIPLAMSNLGMEPNDALCLEIVKFFRNNTQLANNLKWWGANNYILSNEEKLIAKYLINTFADEDRMPGGKELAKALGISQKMLKGRLAFLAKAGLLEESGDGALGYQLAEGYKRWGGPLRHNFHTVSVGGDKPFDVW